MDFSKTISIGLLPLTFLIAINLPAFPQNGNVARCLSIADVNERIDCLEPGGLVSNPETSPTPNVRPPKQPRVGPSFECRAGSNSIERAIGGAAMRAGSGCLNNNSASISGPCLSPSEQRTTV